MQQSRAPRRLFDDILAQLQSHQTEQAIARSHCLKSSALDRLNPYLDAV
jgi:hypothetical protein